MLDVNPFTPQIVERLPEGAVYLYPDLKTYWRDRRVQNTGGSPGWRCQRCGCYFHSEKAAYRADCTIERRVPRLDPSGGWAWNTMVEAGPHVLFVVAHVTTELGDPLPKSTGPYCRWVYDAYAYWMESKSSPLNRGLLPALRVGQEWRLNYLHMPEHLVRRSYRRPRTQQERREAAGWAVDDTPEMPAIRAKRQWGNLVSAWDDQWLPKNRSWKKKRVRKQWMAGTTGRP